MQFNVTLVEPDDYPYGYFLYDYARLVVASLESLGHSAWLGRNSVEPDRINIVLGAHLIWDADDIDAIAANGPFVVIQTELVPGTLGVGSGVSNPNYRRALELATAVWEPYQSNLQPLADLGVERVGLLRHGYHAALECALPKRVQDIDFLFFGSLTPHRVELLGALEDRGHRVVATLDARPVYRNDLLARAKVHLCPRQGELQRQLPVGRIGTVLNNRGLIVVERCDDQAWLEHTFEATDAAGWVETCERVLGDPERDGNRVRRADAYREIRFVDHLAPNVRQLASWLGVDPDDVPGDTP